MNEKKIAFWALIITFFGWVGIKPEHFKSVVITLWEFITTSSTWVWGVIKAVFFFLVDVLSFSVNLPVSIFIITSVICFALGRIQLNKSLVEEENGKLGGNTDPEPLFGLSERQKLILLDIYKYAGQHKSYDDVMRQLRIDSHMLNQAIDQLIELGYLAVVGPYGRKYPDISQYGRDIVIKYLEHNQQDY